MSEVTAHPPGHWCWIELATTDPEAAKGFYADLFGWEYEDTPAGEGMTFTFIRLHGDDVGALYAMPQRQRDQGVPVHWLGYVAVEDADAAAERAGELGGRVLAGPFDVGTAGRNAILRDAQGAAFGVWQARERPGARRVDEPGAMRWRTLLTRDPKAAGGFYGGLFGWRMRGWDEAAGYSEWLPSGGAGGGDAAGSSASGAEAGEPIGGVMPMPRPGEDGTPHWLHTFAVEDPDAAAARAAALGGVVEVPPTDVPGAGRYALVADPQGAVFGVMRFD